MISLSYRTYTGRKETIMEDLVYPKKPMSFSE